MKHRKSLDKLAELNDPVLLLIKQLKNPVHKQIPTARVPKQRQLELLLVYQPVLHCERTQRL